MGQTILFLSPAQEPSVTPFCLKEKVYSSQVFPNSASSLLFLSVQHCQPDPFFTPIPRADQARYISTLTLVNISPHQFLLGLPSLLPLLSFKPSSSAFLTRKPSFHTLGSYLSPSYMVPSLVNSLGKKEPHSLLEDSKPLPTLAAVTCWLYCRFSRKSRLVECFLGR